MSVRLFVLLAAVLGGAAAASAQAHLTRVFPDLPNAEDSWATALRVAGNGDNRFDRVEQVGRITSFLRDSLVAEAPVFLDITDRVFWDDLPEPGLLGLAFHPNYAENGAFYVTYITEDGDGPYRWRLSRFSRVDGPESGPFPTADPDSEVILLDLEKPDWDHNGGDLHFGPDGYLYVTLGDGQCCEDPNEHSQDRTTLYGKLLRLDVDNPAPGLDYGIPPDNPYVGNAEGWREEIWAYGFRNPWRFSIDCETGEVWVGDVGEVTWEEVNLVEAGGNYGWDDMEGPECFEEPNCDPDDYALPVWSYDHTVGVAVIGGHVYRGETIPALRGRYIFSEWALRKLWALDPDPGSGAPPEVTLLEEDLGVTPAGYAVDERGEIYAVDTFSGRIFQLTPANPLPADPEPPAPEEPTLRLWPNPATTTLDIHAPLGLETVAVYDLLGRRLIETPLQPGCQCARLALDLETFPPGVYVARAGDLTETFTVVR
ncbi:MAG: PQQ-dependent sugar dehydrogenase [Rubricoccaceae bacterium]|nr:PQQ-dependent sugar dehydrogenase [Rubricoccaceae bacterium]